MQFKLFGLTWNFKFVLGLAYGLTGLSIFVLVFFIPYMGLWNVPYSISAVVYLATFEDVCEKFK